MEAWVKKYLMEGEDALEPHNGNPYAALHRSKSLTGASGQLDEGRRRRRLLPQPEGHALRR